MNQLLDMKKTAVGYMEISAYLNVRAVSGFVFFNKDKKLEFINWFKLVKYRLYAVEVLSSMTDFERGNALKFHLTLFPLEEYFVRLFFVWSGREKVK